MKLPSPVIVLDKLMFEGRATFSPVQEATYFERVTKK